MLDITGQKFGRLTAVEFSREKKKDGPFWKFRCDCGKTCEVRSLYARNGHTKSCGCFCKEQTSKAKFRHGFSKKRFHNLWWKIIERCDSNDYRYGGRGISICDRWRTFENFFEDMHESYLEHIKKSGEKETTIERIDNNGHYCKENCRWATWSEQCRNKRSNHPLTYKGKTKIMVEWAEEFNIPYHILWKRIRIGWSVEKALETAIMVNQFKFR